MNDTVLILNSANASTIDLTTGHAEFQLDNPLQSNKENVPLLSLNSFTFTNYFYNITAALGNNKIYYSDDDTVGEEEKYNITIPDGSWGYEELNTYIVNKLVEDTTAPGLFELLADNSQNKIYIKFGPTLTGWYVYMGADSPFTLLGLTTLTPYPADQSNVVNEIVYADTTAAFNNVEAINVKTNLSNNFIYGSKTGNTLYSTSPAVGIGSVQIDRPYNLLWQNSETLRSGISKIIIDIVDQDENTLAMAENFAVVLQIKY